MSTFAGKGLAAGEVQTSQAPVFTASAALCTYVKTWSLFNKNAAAQTINTYLSIGGTIVFYRRFVLNQNESADVLSDGATFELSNGDALLADTTTANAVDFAITGVEEN